MPNFGTILPNTVTIKSIRNCLRKSCSALAPKMLVKLTSANRFTYGGISQVKIFAFKQGVLTQGEGSV
jgi:hypothetical protein